MTWIVDKKVPGELEKEVYGPTPVSVDLPTLVETAIELALKPIKETLKFQSDTIKVQREAIERLTRGVQSRADGSALQRIQDEFVTLNSEFKNLRTDTDVGLLATRVEKLEKTAKNKDLDQYSLESLEERVTALESDVEALQDESAEPDLLCAWCSASVSDEEGVKTDDHVWCDSVCLNDWMRKHPLR